MLLPHQAFNLRQGRADAPSCVYSHTCHPSNAFKCFLSQRSYRAFVKLSSAPERQSASRSAGALSYGSPRTSRNAAPQRRRRVLDDSNHLRSRQPLDRQPDNQFEEPRRYAARRGWQVKEYVDHCSSGVKGRRPALDAMLVHATRRRFDVLCAGGSIALAESSSISSCCLASPSSPLRRH